MGKAKFFIAGTDTSVGKTLITAALLHQASQRGLETLALKPVAAGCTLIDGELRNDDALILDKFSSVTLPYQQLNPIALEAPIAPHLAAANVNRRLSADRVAGICRGAMMVKWDLCLVEGAGGWRVPLNARETMADIPILLALPVVLVVGIRLGCLNHAMLSAEAIARDKLPIAGWVANILDPDMLEADANIATLLQRFPFPLLGSVPFQKDITPQEASKHLDISKLLESPPH